MCVCVLCQAVYSASFPEDMPINKGILTVAATDADSGSSAEIQYSLFGIGVEDFYMDANTGKHSCCCCCCTHQLYISSFQTSSRPPGELRSATVMDRETTPSYKLIAQATDGGGLFCRCDISLKVLDVNDNAPAFSSPHYLASVYENAAPKALLTRLQASDPDEGKPACSVPLPQNDNEGRDGHQRALFQPESAGKCGFACRSEQDTRLHSGGFSR